MPAQFSSTAVSSPPPAALPSGGLYVNMWRHAHGARFRLGLSWVMLIGAALLELVSPWLGARALDELQQHGAQALSTAAYYGAAIIAAAVLAWALHGPGRVGERTVALHVRRNFTDALYAKLMRLPLAWHDRHHSGEVQQRISQASLALHSFTQNQFHYIKAVVHFIGAAGALMLFSPSLGLIALAGYALIGFMMTRFDIALMRLASEENAAERRFQSKLLDFLGNVGTIMTLRLHDSTRQKSGERLEEVFVPARRSITLVEAKWCIADLASIALTWGLVAAAVWLSRIDGAILIGGVFMVHQYAQQARSVVLALADKFQTVARSRTDLASADAIWRAADRPPCGAALPSRWQRIRITGLCYEHPARSTGSADAVPTSAASASAGLRHVSLALRRGDRVALVGPSGAGKSTLMRVLAGLYDPRHAVIEVDGEVFPDTRHLGSLASLVPQEADVFEGTIRENASLSGEHADGDIAGALHASAFDAVMADMGLDLDTQLGERGCNLSGGQRQRLCLARGLLSASGASILFLDEPTSALDPVTEENVLVRIGAAFPEACIVSSVHRMNLLRHFNTIVLMANGEVQDAGTVEELAARQPAFREMMRRHGDFPRPPAHGLGSGVEASDGEFSAA
ncbi:ABC-type multidrug transport system, ATPase and permease component [Noviherbaspirillum humi]|uniref:ABC-type multidrug transport system, ATPase and permease component n=1 Tax=Noviherbaspirillum humi TaxID=1688639 RepID=A0A239G6X4_9BURK|nr:ABC transporter ATP-binding protein [Noviherbaspirillum humi]SNS64203.1 ABC-type multidrug transport system, ATPase and permease component [Noviherbaspirillum humi]